MRVASSVLHGRSSSRWRSLASGSSCYEAMDFTLRGRIRGSGGCTSSDAPRQSHRTCRDGRDADVGHHARRSASARASSCRFWVSFSLFGTVEVVAHRRRSPRRAVGTGPGAPGAREKRIQATRPSTFGELHREGLVGVLAQRKMRAILGALYLTVACTTSREVPLSDVWNLDLHVGGPGKRVATIGVLENVSSESDSCKAELVEGNTRLEVNGRGAVCEEMRVANGRRVNVEGIVALGCRVPDVNLRPDGGGGPFLIIDATRVNDRDP